MKNRGQATRAEGSLPRTWQAVATRTAQPGRYLFTDARQDLVNVADAAAQRSGGHLEVGMTRNLAVISRKELGHAPQLRQFAAKAAQVLGRVLALITRL